MGTKLCGCGKYKGKCTCDGCGEESGLWCGHCARPVYVTWPDNIMTQRLCPACRLQGDDRARNGFYDVRHYDLKELEAFFAERRILLQ